ncbi:transcriptional regulator [Brucella tritici]|uniref:Transcriptional regulator n=1 Tax=Brucella tritici TaxID=94626 RepID=A0A7V7VQX6_9HYPH|nr:MucR family transcriptional regulator [Brucella tritici]KAB2655186.1 transcriptional regulator [Brucella tritici]
MTDPTTIALLELTTDIVSSYVSNNSIQHSELPSLISLVHGKLNELQNGPVEVVVEGESQKPAVNPKKSVFDDHIICLEDGKKFQSMKRHLKTVYNLTPDEYRTKWGLPRDYPMVTKNYSAKRSAMAKNMGLGRKPGETPVAQTKKKNS